MGIVDFLKGIFAGKPKVEEQPQGEQNISLSELEEWFAKKETEINSGTELAMEKSKTEFLEALKACEQSCSMLKAAQPRYPKLYEQNKEVAEGNRAAFVVATENLLKSIKFPDSPDTFSSFIQNLNSAFDSFMSSGNRSFIISNEFFTEQTGSIKKNMQNLDKVLQELSTYHKEKKLAEFPQVREKIAKLVQRVRQAEQFEKELKETEALLKDNEARAEKAKKDMSEFLQDQVFLEKQRLEAELKDVQARTRAHEDELHSIFAVLDTPLRKLTWDDPNHEKLVDNYFSDLITAISQDGDFKFGEVLAKLKTAIETGEIYAKDKRRGQALSTIGRFTHEFLQNWLAQYYDLKDKDTELQTQVESSEASAHEYELKTNIQKLEHEQETLNENQAALARNQKRIDLDEEIKDASNMISSLLGYQVKILR